MGSADESKLKKWLQQFLPLLEAEIQGLLSPALTNLGYFLPWFQSLQLPSTQSESPLAPESHVLFKVLSCIWGTTNQDWVGNWIYWTLTDRNCTLPNAHTLQFTTAHTKSSQHAVSSPVGAW
jgi:hypothetical protein